MTTNRKAVTDEVLQLIVDLHSKGCGVKMTAKMIESKLGISIGHTLVAYHRNKLGLKPHIGSSNGAIARHYESKGEMLKRKHEKEQRRVECEKYKGFKDLPLFTDANVFKSRYRNEPTFRIKSVLRRRIRKVIESRGYKPRSIEIINQIGCSGEQLKRHIESQFKPGMSWANFGEWHIDHIIPLASIKGSCETEILEGMIKLNHYTNLQPLWAKDNMRKGSSMPTPTPRQVTPDGGCMRVQGSRA